MFANSFLAAVAWLVFADVTHNSSPTFPRGLRRRVWTETFAGSGRCKSGTSFHRVRHGERWLRPRSFRRWGLWSWIPILSLFCFFLGYCHCTLIFAVTLFPAINSRGSAGPGLWVKNLRAFQRQGANGSVESTAHKRVPDSTQAREGGARLRCAGPRHTSGVESQSRVLAWRFGGFSERTNDTACVSTSTQRKVIGWKAGLPRTTGFTVCTTAFRVEQHEPCLLSCLWESCE